MQLFEKRVDSCSIVVISDYAKGLVTHARDFVPNCMDLISTDMIAGAVLRQLNIARSLR